MIAVRRSKDRGHFNHGWLDTYHTFSFSEYQDPRHMGFQALRVINEDRIAAGQGFGMHPHRDMEIITYVLSGALEHRDSLGNGSVLRAGEFQRMTAGSGIRHSEFNPSDTEPTHLYQIWLFPEQRGLPPSYEEKQFSADAAPGGWRLVASPDGREGSLTIRQDAELRLARLENGGSIEHALSDGRHAWVQIIRGTIRVNDTELKQGDGAAVSNEATLTFEGAPAGEVLLFDLSTLAR